MNIKQALLDSELARVKSFLTLFELDYDPRITETIYLEEDGKIIGTISRLDNLIECLAVDESYRGENLAGKLVSEMLNRFREAHIHHYMVYTKAVYVELFESMNFHCLAKTEKVAILEGGIGSIDDEIGKIRYKMESKWNQPLDSLDIGAMVVNCNPITLGHLGLIEYAAERHEKLVVFVVEEDRSMFTFKERISLVYLATIALQNVLVVPSTKYMVSSLTFPGYFLKSMDEKEEEHARLDAILFQRYFMKQLNLKKRYVGTERDRFMIKYNEILKDALKEQLEIIPRFQKQGVNISASIVRDLILRNRLDEALVYVPEATRALLRVIVRERYDFFTE